MEEFLQRFEDLHHANDSASAGGAMFGLANWMARRQAVLTEEDLALLTAVGSVLFGKAAHEHDSVVSVARSSAQALIEAMKNQGKKSN